MPDIGRTLFELAIMLAAAKIAGELFLRVGQPPVVGELLAGLMLGTIGVIHQTPVYDLISQIGAIVLLFYIGLDNRAGDIWRVGGRALLVGTLGIVFPFVLGYALATAVFHQSQIESIFTATALVATSVGITARVLKDLGLLSTIEARVILGAAVIDDILGMLVLAGVSGLGAEKLSTMDLLLPAIEAIAFLAVVVLLGPRMVRSAHPILDTVRTPNALFVVSIVVALLLSAIAAGIGLAAIIGAFFAGVAFADIAEPAGLKIEIEPLHDFLVPFFFVIVGSKVDLRAFFDTRIITFAFCISFVAIIGKVIGCSLGATGLGRRSKLFIGAAMIPRGEVGIIVSALGLSVSAISYNTYAALLFMTIATTVCAPPILNYLARSSKYAM